MARQLKLRLQGEHAVLGQVPASDVAKLIIAFERAVADAAAQIAGRRPGMTGRKGGTVEAATRLRLVAVRKGSVMPVLELPVPEAGPSEFDLEARSLGELAVDATLACLEGSEEDWAIASSLAQIADEVGIGLRYTSLVIEDFQGTHQQRSVVLDPAARDRLRRLAAQPVALPNAVTGTVFEADFERRSAKLRTALNQVVSISFADDLADQIQDVLRRQTEVQGRVTYDPKTGEALQVQVTEIIRTEQLLMQLGDADDFWMFRSVEELMLDRTSPPVSDPGSLVDPDASDEEKDAFLAAIEGLG
jgi:hypothetical protein